MTTRWNRLRSPRICAPLLVAVALAAPATPAQAFGGGGQGVNLKCTASDPSVITTYQTPVTVSGGGSLDCPAPGTTAPGGFGPPQGTPTFTQPKAGDPCTFVYPAPTRFKWVPGSGAMFLTESPANLATNDASTTTFTPDTWRGANLSMTNQPPGTPWTSGDAWYSLAGKADYFLTFTFKGTWTQKPDGLHCIGNSGWSTRCSGTSLSVPCFDTQPIGVTATAPAPISALGIDLNAFLRGKFNGGTITSLPNAPRNPGLTNIATCFYVNGTTANGAPAGPQQDVYLEQIVPGQPVFEGRQIYFVFIIHIYYQRTEWNFGDGSVAGSPPPADCPAPSTPQSNITARHVYTRYSPAGGFPVTVNHHYVVDVSEFWNDSAGFHQQDTPGVVPDLVVPGNPQPFLMPIVQEEGVPVGA
jgi:hypothetical protein